MHRTIQFQTRRSEHIIPHVRINQTRMDALLGHSLNVFASCTMSIVRATMFFQ